MYIQPGVTNHGWTGLDSRSKFINHQKQMEHTQKPTMMELPGTCSKKQNVYDHVELLISKLLVTHTLHRLGSPFWRDESGVAGEGRLIGVLKFYYWCYSNNDYIVLRLDAYWFV